MLDYGTLIKESALVLRRHYIIAVPSIIAVLIVFFVSLAVIPSPEDTRRLVVMGFFSMLLSLYAHGVTLAMAREALETGSTSLNTASFIATRLAGTFVAAIVIIIALVTVGFMLLVIPGLIAGFFLMFTLPSVVADSAGTMEALQNSFTVIRANMRDALMFYGILIAFGLIFSMANILLSVVPVIGQVAGVILSGAFWGFVSVLMMDVYKTLKRKASLSQAL